MTYAWFNIDGRQVYRRVPEERVSKRSDLAAPMIKRDRIPPTQCMVDGKFYESASELKRVHDVHGMVSVGEFDSANPKRPEVKRIDTAEAAKVYDKATSAINNGFKPEVHDANF